MKILYVYEERIPEDLQELVLSYIKKPNWNIRQMTYLTPDDEKKALLTWADVVLFAPGRFLEDEVMEAAKNVKLMQIWSSGYDKFNIKAADKFRIPVANNGGSNASSVAEHAVLLMLASLRRLPEHHARTITGTWRGNKHGMDLLKIENKTIGIIGFGNIGRLVAKKLRGFDANVIYYDPRRATVEEEKELNVTAVDFNELLKQSDIITLHLHSNEQTKNLLDRNELESMKTGSVLVNVSRAQLVNYDVLTELLNSGHIRNAGLDVYMKEPTTGDEEILRFPHIVATPHIAGSTYDTYVEVMNKVVANFEAVEKGEKPQWVVNNP